MTRREKGHRCPSTTRTTSRKNSRVSCLLSEKETRETRHQNDKFLFFSLVTNETNSVMQSLPRVFLDLWSFFSTDTPWGSLSRVVSSSSQEEFLIPWHDLVFNFLYNKKAFVLLSRNKRHPIIIMTAVLSPPPVTHITLHCLPENKQSSQDGVPSVMCVTQITAGLF